VVTLRPRGGQLQLCTEGHGNLRKKHQKIHGLKGGNYINLPAKTTATEKESPC